MSGIRIVVEGMPPRTKKTSNRLVKIGNFHKILPSEAYMEWFKAAMRTVPQIKSWARKEGIVLPLKGPVHVKAVFYRDALRGDLTGYMQAVADWLQSPVINLKTSPPRMTRDGADVIVDDSQIESWDGTRLAKDKARPRIEIEIRPYQEHIEMFTGHEVYGVKE